MRRRLTTLAAACGALFPVCAALHAQDPFEHADDSGLDDTLPFFGGRTRTRAAIPVERAVDWADYDSQVAIHLRLNGLQRPTAKTKDR
jgi:hypothetical protein